MGRRDMERKLGTFGLADFMAAQRRARPNFLDAIDSMLKWQRIEKLLRKKLGRSEENAGGKSGARGDLINEKSYFVKNL